MNKVVSTTDRVFMCITGASGTGKTQLILSMLSKSATDNEQHTTFIPSYNKIIYFYRHWQPIYEEFTRRLTPVVIEFIQSADAETLDSLVNNASGNINHLLIFDDSCEEILQSAAFANLATSGRHKGMHVIFIKHNMYQQGKYSVTIDKNTTHIIMMKSPRVGKQLKILGQELGFVTVPFLESCYKKATTDRFGHLMIDLSPTCNDLLRICSNICGGKDLPTLFHIPASSFSDVRSIEYDEQTNDLYAKALSYV